MEWTFSDSVRLSLLSFSEASKACAGLWSRRSLILPDDTVFEAVSFFHARIFSFPAQSAAGAHRILPRRAAA